MKFKVKILVYDKVYDRAHALALRPEYSSIVAASEGVRAIFHNIAAEDACLVPCDKAAEDLLNSQEYIWNGYEFFPINM